MLRTSSYTIYVDLPDSRDEMLLVHGYTGAYDRVSRKVANYLRGLESRRPPKPLYGEWASEPDRPTETTPPDGETIKMLESRGYLNRLSPEQEEELFGRLALKLHERAKQRVLSYIFMPTYNCNLRCSYCFQDHMRTNPDYRHLLRTMAPEMVDRYFKAIPGIEAKHGLKENPDQIRDIGFFGGEPLLAQNRPIVERIIRRALELGKAEFWAVSNATELDVYEDLLHIDGIRRLQITLDGPPEEHDKRRIYADGSGSFAKIAKNIDMALARKVQISIRLNLDRANIQHLPTLADEIVERGWIEYSNFGVYTAPIHAGNDKTERKTTFNSWQLDQEITKLREQYPNLKHIGRPDEGIRVRARQIFDQKEVTPTLRPSFCSAHDQMYIFDAFGDVYACWERTGEENIRIAHVDEQAEIHFKYEIRDEWRSRSVASNPVCKRCRYALSCGGGCAILALGQRGTMHANYCDGYASRFRASIADAYVAFRKGEDATPLDARVCDL